MEYNHFSGDALHVWLFFQFPCHLGSYSSSLSVRLCGPGCIFVCPNSSMVGKAWDFLVCAQLLMPVNAHGDCVNIKRVCTESWLWEKNPLPRQEIEHASAVRRTWHSTHWATSLPSLRRITCSVISPMSFLAALVSIRSVISSSLTQPTELRLSPHWDISPAASSHPWLSWQHWCPSGLWCPPP